MTNNLIRLLAQSSAWAVTIGLSTSAFAQEVASNPQSAAGEQAAASSDDASPSSGSDIIVTGSQIRGIKPVGSSVISQSREEIDALGVSDTRQVLAQLPQSNSFLGLPQPGNGVIGAGTLRVPVNRATLRNIPQVNGGSGQPTLVLIDGHRVVPSGIEQQVVDLAIIPQGIIDRTEIILDGASAVYGSDAVAGVINIITRKRFNGTANPPPRRPLM